MLTRVSSANGALNAKWYDGQRSNTGVWAIHASESAMRVYLDVPGPRVLVDAKPTTLAVAPGDPAQFRVRVVNTGKQSDTITLSTGFASRADPLDWRRTFRSRVMVSERCVCTARPTRSC